MHATPSVALPGDAGRGIPARSPAPMQIGSRTFRWTERTYLMGVINVTPDSFSGDGLLAGERSQAVDVAVAHARQMDSEGADVLDVGGESTRPGHQRISLDEEIER